MDRFPRCTHRPTKRGDQSGREAHDFMSQFLSKILACKLVSVACEPSLWPLLPRAPGNYSSLLRIIARAHDIQGRLSQNTKLTVHDIAREERVTAAYLYTLLRLSWLAPERRCSRAIAATWVYKSARSSSSSGAYQLLD
jgi:hypothetical protein